MSEEMASSYPVDGVNRVKRRQDRGFYDHYAAGRWLEEAVKEAYEKTAKAGASSRA